MNNCNIIGTLTRLKINDIEVKGKSYRQAIFDVAVKRKGKSKTTDFLPCVAYGVVVDIIEKNAYIGGKIGLGCIAITKTINVGKESAKTAVFQVETIDFLTPKDGSENPASALIEDINEDDIPFGK